MTADREELSSMGTVDLLLSNNKKDARAWQVAVYDPARAS